MEHEGFATDEDDHSNNAWSVMPWMVPEAVAGAEHGDPAAAGRGIQWGPGVSAAVPPLILEFLQACHVAEGCELLAGWAAEGLPGLDAASAAVVVAAADGGPALEAADSHAGAGACGCQPGGGVLCAEHEALCRLLELWAASFVEADLEALQNVLRCTEQLGRRHAQLRPASAAALGRVQCEVERVHGGRMRLCTTFG